MKKMRLFKNTRKGTKYTIICGKGIVYNKVYKFSEMYADKNEIVETYSADEFVICNYISSYDKLRMMRNLEIMFEDYEIKFVSNNIIHIYDKKREA